MRNVFKWIVNHMQPSISIAEDINIDNQQKQDTLQDRWDNLKDRIVMGIKFKFKF